MKSPCQEESGVTLLELMFASGVLAMGLVMLFGALMSITTVSKNAEQRQVASGCLQTAMEQLRGSSYTQLLEYVPPAVSGLGVSAGIVVECLDGGGGFVALPLGSGGDETQAPSADDLPNPLEVRATVIWLDNDGRAASLSSSTMFWR